MSGLSELAKLFLKISDNLTEKEATRLRETLATDYHLGKATVENKLPHQIFNMLVEDNKMALVVDVLRKLGKAKFADKVQNLMEEQTDSGPIHSTKETPGGYLVPTLFMIGIGIFMVIGLQGMHAMQHAFEKWQNPPQTRTRMTRKEPTSGQEDGEVLRRLEQQIETLTLRLEQQSYIKRCESGEIKLPGSSIKDGFGARTDYRTRAFSMPFDKKPVVTIGLTKLDHPGSDVRVKVEIVSVSTTGMTVCFTTWNQSKLYGAIVNWMACA